MTRFKRALHVVVATAATAAIGIVAAPNPAVAGATWEPLTRSCGINARLPFASCNSGFVEANPTWHSVWFTIDPYPGCGLEWRVRDGVNGNLVGSGYYDGPAMTSSIGGLYSWYRVEISRSSFRCGGDASIRNN